MDNFQKYINKFNELKLKEYELNNEINLIKDKLYKYTEKYPELKKPYAIGSNTIQFKQNNTHSSITQKYLRESLINYFDNNLQLKNKVNIDDLINYILNHRKNIVKDTIIWH